MRVAARALSSLCLLCYGILAEVVEAQYRAAVAHCRYGGSQCEADANATYSRRGIAEIFKRRGKVFVEDL
jgi:hypothetical protein